VARSPVDRKPVKIPRDMAFIMEHPAYHHFVDETSGTMVVYSFLDQFAGGWSEIVSTSF
jgi:hypothetical protein